MTAPTEELSVHRRDADMVVAVSGNLLIQVRRGPMTVPALTQIASLVRSVNARRTGPSGALSIVEPEAPLASLEMRRRQSQVIGDLMQEPRNHVAVVTPGEGVTATLGRSVARLLLRGSKRVAVVDTLEEAAAWLGPRIQLPEARIRAVAEHVRALR